MLSGDSVSLTKSIGALGSPIQFSKRLTKWGISYFEDLAPPSPNIIPEYLSRKVL